MKQSLEQLGVELFGIVLFGFTIWIVWMIYKQLKADTMKIKTKIDDKEVTITLTKEQLSDIKKQTSSIITIDDINSYADACKILKRKIVKCSPTEELLTIIAAANFVDNGGKVWTPDFSNSDYKYLPILIKKSGEWAFSSSRGFSDGSDCSAGYFYKSKETSEVIPKRFIKLYGKVFDSM